MENIVRTIRVYYPVSDEALATLAHGFEKQVFPVKTLIIRAGQALNSWKHWKKHWSILFPLKRLMSCISQI